MSKQPCPSSYDEVLEILKPLFDAAVCEHVTLTSLRTDKSLTPKLWELGDPALLTIGDYLFILVSSKSYFELETKRQALVQRCIAIETGIKPDAGPFKPAMGRLRKMPDTRLRDLARIESAMHAAKKRVKQDKWRLKIEKEKLSELQAERESLMQQLKNENIVADEQHSGR